MQKYSLLFSSFDEQFWYFESVDMLRKLLCSSVVVVAYQGYDVQLWIATLLAVFFLVLYMVVQPYRDPVCAHVQTIAMAHLVLLYPSAMLFVDQGIVARYGDQLGLLVILGTVIVCVVVVLLLVFDVGSAVVGGEDLRLLLRGQPVQIPQPRATQGYHIFCSHCWSFGQEYAKPPFRYLTANASALSAHALPHPTLLTQMHV